MTPCSSFHRWVCDPDRLGALTPARVRDMIIDCFFEAQKETYARARKDTGVNTTDEDLKKIVWGAVRLAFDKSGVDFCRPSKEGLRRVVKLLASKASSWETPQEIIEYNVVQANKAIDALPNDR